MTQSKVVTKRPTWRGSNRFPLVRIGSKCLRSTNCLGQKKCKIKVCESHLENYVNCGIKKFANEQNVIEIVELNNMCSAFVKLWEVN